MVDALSRIGDELLAMVVFTQPFEMLQAILDNWDQDLELKKLIEEVQVDSTKHSQYTWSHQQLRRKSKLVAGKGPIRQTIISHWHNTLHGGHLGLEATLKRLQTLFY